MMHFVFGAMTTFINQTTEFNIWMKLLKQVDKSVLWLYENNKWMKANLIKEAELRGVNADRLVFCKKTNHDDYLAQLKHADLFLDTFNYNAATTCSNALWTGLPVVTTSGKSSSTRVAGSLLMKQCMNYYLFK